LFGLEGNLFRGKVPPRLSRKVAETHLPNLFNLCNRFVELIWERRGKKKEFSVEFG